LGLEYSNLKTHHFVAPVSLVLESQNMNRDRLLTRAHYAWINVFCGKNDWKLVDVRSWVHCNCYKNDTYLCDEVLNLSVVDESSSFDRVYVRPVTVPGSTVVRMFLIWMMCTSSFTGYLKDLLGPCGWRSVNFTWAAQSLQAHM